MSAGGAVGRGRGRGQGAASPEALAEALLAGDRGALARALSWVEDGEAGTAELLGRVHARAVGAAITGITGPIGSGKSTLADALTALYRRQGTSVGVVAVDPSSPLTGGALLGDRVRMQRHSTDAGVFVRSMATRGNVGGLAAAAYDALTLLAAAGFRRLLVETVGVGQDEVEVASVAHTTCVVVTPGTGDEIQAIKAGILEVADVLVLNKADLPGADRAEAQLRAWVAVGEGNGWTPPVVRTVARDGQGIEELARAIAAHEELARGSPQGAARERALAALRFRARLRERLLLEARRAGLTEAREAELIAAIAAGELDPYSAAEQVVAEFLHRGGGR